MKTIAFDCDGPLADFTKGFCNGLTMRGFERTPADIKHWDLAASLTPEEVAIQDEIIGAPGFCVNLEWVAGAKNLVRYFRAMSGVDVVCVTSPYPSSTWIPERLEWLSEVFPLEDVLFVRSARKRLIRAEVLVEDHPGIAGAWLDAHPDGVAILVDRPWNQPSSKEFWPHARMYRAHDLGEIVSIAREFLT